MTQSAIRSVLGIVLALLIATAIGWAGSQGGATVGSVPLFALCGGLAFLINWIAFIPSWIGQTERYFDLTGSLSYLALIALALSVNEALTPRSLLIATAVIVWALRLGSFLFLRILADGADGRFDRIKPDFGRLLTTWTLQGLWVFLTLSCGLAALTTRHAAPLGAVEAIGALIWLLGFGIEVAADRQKRAFRADPAQAGRFITTGLWAWSRHPNYAGEILLWIGIALMALPALEGWQHATLISPFFVYVLLTRISGIPLLEARGRKRWGNEPGYRDYVARTPALFPWPGRGGTAL